MRKKKKKKKKKKEKLILLSFARESKKAFILFDTI